VRIYRVLSGVGEESRTPAVENKEQRGGKERTPVFSPDVTALQKVFNVPPHPRGMMHNELNDRASTDGQTNPNIFCHAFP
jgi:hypothetical protein